MIFVLDPMEFNLYYEPLWLILWKLRAFPEYEIVYHRDAMGTCTEIHVEFL